VSVGLSGLGKDWIRKEFHHIDFGDKRLRKRFFETAEFLSAKASASIHQSCHGAWPLAKGAYRLFGNERVRASEILCSHRRETKKRLRGHSRLFSIQDTSHLDFDSHQKTQGLGSISKAYRKHKRGLMLHAALMVTEQGLPLGLSASKCWSRVAREETAREKQRRIYTSAIREKESVKWIDALQETVAITPAGCELITIGDREADIFEFVQSAQSLDTSFIVRNRQDRRFINAKGKKTKLRSALSRSPLLRTIAIEIPENRNRAARTAHVEIRATSGALPIRNHLVYGPKGKTAGRHIHEKVPVYVIGVKERHPPKGVEAVDWVLLTNLPVTDADSAVEKVMWYGLRWKIEEFFRTLKSGCSIEQCRLNTAEKLMKMVMLKSVIAFKLMYLAKAAVSHPDAACTQVLTNVEWQTLYRRAHQTATLPKYAPTVLQAVIWLGQLGGFLNRRSDGLPGMMSLWRGYEILQESIQMSLILRPRNCG
jgi:hypothetical protein